MSQDGMEKRKLNHRVNIVIRGPVTNGMGGNPADGRGVLVANLHTPEFIPAGGMEVAPNPSFLKSVNHSNPVAVRANIPVLRGRPKVTEEQFRCGREMSEKRRPGPEREQESPLQAGITGRDREIPDVKAC